MSSSPRLQRPASGGSTGCPVTRSTGSPMRSAVTTNRLAARSPRGGGRVRRRRRGCDHRRACRLRGELRPGKPASDQRAVRRQPQPCARAGDRGAHPAEEIGSGYFQETHPQELFRECSVYRELVSVPEQLPRVLEIAMRAALEQRGVAVVVVPGRDLPRRAGGRAGPPDPGEQRPSIRPSDDALAAAAGLLTASRATTILAGAGCAGPTTSSLRSPASCRRRSFTRCAARSSSSTTTRSTSA